MRSSTATSGGCTEAGSSPACTGRPSGGTRRSSWPPTTSCNTSTAPPPDIAGGGAGQPEAPPVKFQEARCRAGQVQQGASPCTCRPAAASRRRRCPDGPGTSACGYDWVNRKLRTGRGDLAVLDQPDAVAGQPGDHQAPRVEHPGVPEVGDQQPAPDPGDQRGHRRVGGRPVDLGPGARPLRRRSVRHRARGQQAEVRGRGPERARRARAWPVRRRSRPRPRCAGRASRRRVRRRRRPGRRRRRGALGVERHAGRAGRQRVVDDRDRRVELGRAELARTTAARCTALPLKPKIARFCSRSATAVGSSTTS